MSAALIASIRRLPGGILVKAPRSQNMPGIPFSSTAENYATYFNPWPKKRAEFLLYGSRRSQHTNAGMNNCPQQQKSTSMHDNIVDGIVYGPRLAEAKLDNTGNMPAQGQPPPKQAKMNTRALGLAGVLNRFHAGHKITMVTAYDFPSARVARGAGVEMVLVGDSLGNCRLGLTDTIGVTMRDMVRATSAVRRGVDAPAPSSSVAPDSPKPVIVGDMPFGSYLVKSKALRNAASLRVAGADMVKLEGGRSIAPLVKALTKAGIAVVGHIGLEPQHAVLQGGLKLQGRTAQAALEIVRDAQALVAAGAKIIVVECVPMEVARAVEATVDGVPVIGIGAGHGVSGQVLVCDDLLGMHGAVPSFVKKYADLERIASEAYASYRADVQRGNFPAAEHSHRMHADEFQQMCVLLQQEGFDVQPSMVHGMNADEFAPNHSFRKQPEPPVGPLGAMEFRKPRHGMLELKGGHFLPFTRTHHGAHFSNSVRTMTQLTSANRVHTQVLHTREQVGEWRQTAGRVAFVPTMGNLHDGHLELVDEARKHADKVLVSIFVNPSQFAEHEDLDRYPRTMDRDLELLQARGVDAVFTPTVTDLYPFGGSPGGTVVVPRFVQGKSEDACRPHFFTGVATVCLKLFNICMPNVVVFGQKDAMQCAVIARMLDDFFLSSRISMVVAATSREDDGLARSSRNSYLTPTMRKAAPAIYVALMEATQAPDATPGSVRQVVQEQLEHLGMVISYVSVADPREMSEKSDNDALANSIVSIACLLEDNGKQCRLIDNIIVPA